MEGEIMKTVVIGAGSDLGIHIDGTSLGPTQLLRVEI